MFKDQMVYKTAHYQTHTLHKHYNTYTLSRGHKTHNIMQSLSAFKKPRPFIPKFKAYYSQIQDQRQGHDWPSEFKTNNNKIQQYANIHTHEQVGPHAAVYLKGITALTKPNGFKNHSLFNKKKSAQ